MCIKSNVTILTLNDKNKVTGRSENLWLENSQGFGEGSM